MEVVARLALYIAAILTLMVFSFPIFGESRFWRFAEYTFLGAAAGYYVVFGLVTLGGQVSDLLYKSRYANIIGLVLGALVLAAYSKKASLVAISRWPIALLIGVGTGAAVRAYIDAQLVRQIQATILPPWTGNPLTSISNVVVIVLVVCCSTYFFVTREHRGLLQIPTRLGRYGLMIAFGAIFGSFVVTRISLVIGRLQFLLSLLH
jgi:hypothetical protein